MTRSSFSMSLKERWFDFVARLHHGERPNCNTCGTPMRYCKVGDFWAWTCPHQFDHAHVTIAEDVDE